jgi:hypothetical protein
MLATLVVLSMSGPLLADETSLRPLQRPDPASVTVAKLDVSSSDDYFYFWKPTVSYETAFSDLDDCRIYSLSANFLAGPPPRFVPFGSQPTGSERGQSANIGASGMYGPMGSAIAALIFAPVVESVEDDNAQAANRRCMAYKGYSRYGTSSASWKQLRMGTDADKLARMALIASGPPPTAGAIGP